MHYTAWKTCRPNGFITLEVMNDSVQLRSIPNRRLRLHIMARHGHQNMINLLRLGEILAHGFPF